MRPSPGFPAGTSQLSALALPASSTTSRLARTGHSAVVGSLIGLLNVKAHPAGELDRVTLRWLSVIRTRIALVIGRLDCNPDSGDLRCDQQRWSGCRCRGILAQRDVQAPCTRSEPWSLRGPWHTACRKHAGIV